MCVQGRLGASALVFGLLGAAACGPPAPPVGPGGGPQCPGPAANPRFVGLGDDVGQRVCVPGGVADIMKGHLMSASQGYELFGNIGRNGPLDGNCHNAALHGPADGAVICQGDPTMANDNYKDMAQYHTFQWLKIARDGAWAERVDPGLRPQIDELTRPTKCEGGTLFMNWSGANAAKMYFVCKLPAANQPPDLTDQAPDAAGHSFYKAGDRDGAWIGCGSQHVAGGGALATRAVNGDGDLESPDAGVCKAWVARHPPANAACTQDLCVQCCHGRKDFWLPNLPLCGATAADATDFDDKCVAECKR